MITPTELKNKLAWYYLNLKVTINTKLSKSDKVYMKLFIGTDTSNQIHLTLKSSTYMYLHVNEYVVCEKVNTIYYDLVGTQDIWDDL